MCRTGRRRVQRYRQRVTNRAATDRLLVDNESCVCANGYNPPTMDLGQATTGLKRATMGLRRATTGHGWATTGWGRATTGSRLDAYICARILELVFICSEPQCKRYFLGAIVGGN